MYRRLISYLIYFSFTGFTSAQDTLFLSHSNNYYGLDNTYIQIYEDSSNHSSTPADVKDKTFVPIKTLFFKNDNPQSTYWIKINIVDLSEAHYYWCLLSYNYAADSLDVYLLQNDTLKTLKTYRFHNFKLSQQDIVNKHFTVYLPLTKNKPAELFIRLKNKKPYQYGFAIREYREYFFSSVGEYFFFGVFYGGILLMCLYHLILFISLRQPSYLLYVFYILIQGAYMCMRDAIALVYLFPDSRYMIPAIYNVIMMCMGISVLVYVRSFLQLADYKWFNSILIVFIAIRILLYYALPDYPIELMCIDVFAIYVSIFFSLQSLLQGNKTALLMFGGLSMNALGYTINILWHANLIDNTENVFYSLYYTTIAEALLLAFANAYRLKKLRDVEYLKEELEKKVKESKAKIQHQEDIILQKSDELDVFLYRASHDIKGPLLSIKGLCEVGMMEKENKDEYFRHIQATAARLQHILNAILDLAKTNRKEVKKEKIHLKQLFEICLYEHLKEYPGFNEMQFQIHIPSDKVIYSDKYLMMSVIQNLLENAIKYRDQNKKAHVVNIELNEYEEEYELKIEDNGVGIPEQALSKIFQMFYRAHDKGTSGAGLGLYIVKQNIEKMNGKIFIESEEGKYTRFSIRLPK
ncbi:MAG: sensor histidine kinase [Cytophagaceae bacterium]|nr:sensor histidine kinase [Cytophagaceae bacterium]MDW8455940.1 sensor histidine kinase [Cytophagaceae bacterium]